MHDIVTEMLPNVGPWGDGDDVDTFSELGRKVYQGVAGIYSFKLNLQILTASAASDFETGCIAQLV